MSKKGVSKQVPCSNCGSPLHRTAYKLAHRTNHFCNVDCESAWRSKHHRGENSPSWRRIRVLCDQCGKAIMIYPSRSRQYERHFCGKECKADWHSENKSRENSPTYKGATVEKACEICGKLMVVKRSWPRRGRGRFCSLKCRGEWMASAYAGEGSVHWRGGLSYDPYPKGWIPALRRRIRARDQECLICGKTSRANVVGGRVAELDVHHIDYDKTNLSDSNLCCLCRRCHMKTNRDRELWKSVLERLVDQRLVDGVMAHRPRQLELWENDAS